jgi:hypothetical protein
LNGQPHFDVNEKYEDAWLDRFQKTLVPAARTSARTCLFLHAAKTGGSSLYGAIRKSSNWKVRALSDSAFGYEGCSCGLRGCTANQPIKDKLNFEKLISPKTNLLVKLGHEKYSAAHWLRTRFAAVEIPVAEVFMTYRPIRDRLRSMFRDYWTQVGEAEAIIERTKTANSHVTRKVLHYYRDSRHYSSGNNQIDGLAWFKAFEIHGPGMPFFLSEIFDSPIQLKNEIESARVSLIPTAQLDSVLPTITGLQTVERRRVSSPVRAEAVENALADATELIDSLCQRDIAFEEVVASSLSKDSSKCSEL